MSARPPTPYPVFRKKGGAPESEKNEVVEYCKEMLQKSMLTGVPQIVTAPTTRSKVFKTFVVLGSFTGFLYQTSAFLVMYFAYPTLVDVQVTTPPFVDVPSMTICNRNGLRRRAYCSLKPDNCHVVDIPREFCHSFPESCDQEGRMKGGNMFRIIASAQDVPSSSRASYNYDHHGNEIVFNAVVCEQFLIRDFLRNTFFRHHRSLLHHPDFVISVCDVMWNHTENWDFFQRLLRCTALIAEYFLYRYSQLNEDPQLHRAPLIWVAVFQEHFEDEFCDNRQWEGLRNYSEAYAGMHGIVDRALLALRAPADNFHPRYMEDVPWSELPATSALSVHSQMLSALIKVDRAPVPPQKPQNGKQVPRCLPRSPNVPGASGPSQLAVEDQSGPSSSCPNMRQDLQLSVESLAQNLSNQLGMEGGDPGLGNEGPFSVRVTPPTPEASPDGEEQQSGPMDPVDRREEAESDEATTSSLDSDSTEYAPPSSASPDSKCRKRRNSDDDGGTKQPSPKQLKSNS